MFVGVRFYDFERCRSVCAYHFLHGLQPPFEVGIIGIRIERRLRESQHSGKVVVGRHHGESSVLVAIHRIAVTLFEQRQ